MVFASAQALARKLALDEFEKGVVVMLTGTAPDLCTLQTISALVCNALLVHSSVLLAAVSISPVVKSIFEAENGDGSYRRSSEAVQVLFATSSKMSLEFDVLLTVFNGLCSYTKHALTGERHLNCLLRFIQRTG